MNEYLLSALRTCVKYLHKEMNPASDVMSYKFHQPITFFICIVNEGKKNALFT